MNKHIIKRKANKVIISTILLSVITLNTKYIGINHSYAETESFETPEELLYGDIDENPKEKFYEQHNVYDKNKIVETDNDIKVHTPNDVNVKHIDQTLEDQKIISPESNSNRTLDGELKNDFKDLNSKPKVKMDKSAIKTNNIINESIINKFNPIKEGKSLNLIVIIGSLAVILGIAVVAFNRLKYR